MKWDLVLQKIAGDIVGFVDDLRVSAFSVEEAWQVAHQVVAQLQYMGIQDVPRKRCLPHQCSRELVLAECSQQMTEDSPSWFPRTSGIKAAG
jgi:hypothetical protein